ncbi:MAG: hypothetical protein HC915_04720 [Anaerolineae bacterium]|nr:hypothetical protein [Anaerolineae bacterium]
MWQAADIRQALGYAITEATAYTGLFQRNATSTRLLYLLSALGNVYEVSQNAAWREIVPPPR